MKSPETKEILTEFFEIYCTKCDFIIGTANNIEEAVLVRKEHGRMYDHPFYLAEIREVNRNDN